MPTTADYLGDLVNLRKELAEALACNPALVKASEDETFNSLIPKALAIRDEFNKVTNNGINMYDAFAWSTITAIPSIPTSNCENFEGMARQCRSLITVASLDVSKGTTFMNMFYEDMLLQSVGALNTSKGTNFSGMFSFCRNLHTIESIDFTSAKMFTTAWYDTHTTFQQCWSLVNLNVKGSIPISFPIGECSSLSNESAKSIIRALINYSGTPDADKNIVTFHAHVKTRLTDEGNTSPNGNTWLEYVTDKGWKVG